MSNLAQCVCPWINPEKTNTVNTFTSYAIAFKVHRLYCALQIASSGKHKRINQIKYVSKDRGMYLELRIEWQTAQVQPSLAPPPSRRLWAERRVLWKCRNKQQLKHWNKKSIFIVSVIAFETIWKFQVGFDSDTLYTTGERRKGAQGVKGKKLIGFFFSTSAFALNIFILIHLIHLSWPSTLKLPKMSLRIKPSMNLIFFTQVPWLHFLSWNRKKV